MSNELIFANPINSGDGIRTFRVKCGREEKIVDAEQLIQFMKEGRIQIANLELTNSGLLWTPPRDVMNKKADKALEDKKMELIHKNSGGLVEAKSTQNKPIETKSQSTPVTPPVQQTAPVSTSDIKISSTVVSNGGSKEHIKIKELVDTLNKARAVYEQGEGEIMSNFEYDRLYDELLKLEKETGIVLANSPTQNVGYEVVSELEKRQHETPMLSLDKTKSLDDLVSFLQGKEGVLSWKLDGLTVVLTYNNGVLENAVTRGNGTIGELVTNNAKQFKNIPHQIPFKGKLVVRGEAIISYSSFNKINESLPAGETKYENPRNLCSGSVRRLDSKITAQRDVNMHIFELVEAQGITIPSNVDEQLKWLTQQGFQCVEYIIVSPKLTDINSVSQAVEYFKQRISTYDIPSDGLVITFRDRDFGMSLGRTSKFYRHSKAFKWQDEVAETTLKDIEWQVGRSGVITPVAVFEPVRLEGSTVEKASLHNISVMEDLLGKPYVGQKIKVFKANMIIPQVAWGEKA